MEKLMELGFENAATATWRNPPDRGNISIEIEKFETAKNILYAIIFHSVEKEDDIPVKSEVVYIGHTRKTLRNRMNGYQSGCGTAVNNRVHEAIKDHLSTGGTVSVMVLPDRHGLRMHGLHLDVAAGLEYALIDHYCLYNRDQGHRPLFNRAGNNCLKTADKQEIDEASEDVLQEIQEENADYTEPPLGRAAQVRMPGPGDDCRMLPCSFQFVLTSKTYWPKHVFNVPVKCDQHFGPDGDLVQVELTGQNPAHLEVYVDRNANQITHAPRIYFGGENAEVYQRWKQANHVVGNTVTVEVIGRNSIRMI